MRSKSDRNQRGGRPAKKQRQRICEQPTSESERARDIAALEHRDSLHRESTGEKHRKKNENNSDELALESRASRMRSTIALGQVRVE